MTKLRPLEGMVVTEVAGREAVGICGSLLQHLGAEVVVVEPAAGQGQGHPRGKYRDAFLVDKKSVTLDPALPHDAALLKKLLERSDVILGSSDDTPLPQAEIVLLCDITAHGPTGPEAGRPASEIELQAALGLMDTTGWADGPPLAVGLPLIGYLAGTYACAAVLSAHRARREQGIAQRVDISMFDTGFLSLNAFLAGVLTGKTKDRGRLGNQHPTTPAWNLFKTSDGHVLICAGSQSQWVKLCDVIGKPNFVTNFATAPERMTNLPEIEAAITAWTQTIDTATSVDRLVKAGIAAGPIAPVKSYPIEENLNFRGMIRDLEGAQGAKVSGSPITLEGIERGKPGRLSVPGADRAFVEALVQSPRPNFPSPAGQAAAPLSGLKVLELGQYTTVPLCARNLALLGAEVIKVEKPGGDESRSYPPRKGERSEVYVMMNSSKQSIMLDLQKPEGKAILRDLLKDADILIENNKPGTLERYGLSPADLQRDFPRLIHCAVSGFGINSIYGDRPGFDTVIQAMSGLMTAVNPGGLPLKTGISASDLMGSEMSLVALLAAVEQRERTGRGQIIDVSMQDISCWLTETLWNQTELAPTDVWLSKVADGHIVIDLPKVKAEAALQKAGLDAAALAPLSRAEAVARLREAGLRAESVNSVKEATLLPQTRARALWTLEQEDGMAWPALGDLFLFQVTKSLPPRRAPDLDADRDAILARIG